MVEAFFVALGFYAAEVVWSILIFVFWAVVIVALIFYFEKLDKKTK